MTQKTTQENYHRLLHGDGARSPRPKPEMERSIDEEWPMNSGHEMVPLRTMSQRMGTTQEQISTIAAANIGQMTMQMEQWRAKLDAFVARLATPQSTSIDNYHEAIDALQAKYAFARERLDEFKSADNARWDHFKPSIDRSWNDLEAALDRLASRLGHLDAMNAKPREPPTTP